jgi:hypothetical protein
MTLITKYFCPRKDSLMPLDSAADSVSIKTSPVTIALLREHVKTDLTLGERRKREFLTGLSSYAKYLHIDPEHGDPTFAANRTKIERFAPASTNIGQRRWGNILSDVTMAFRRYGIPVRLRPLPGNLSREWSALRDRIQHDLRLLRGLSALMHYGSARGIAPAEVTDEALETFHRYLTDETREKRPDRVFQRVCVLWRRATVEIAGWPQQPVSLPSFRNVVSFAWSQFDPSLLTEIEEWKAVVGGQLPFDERAPDKAFRSTTLATKLEQLRRYLSALVRSGTPIEQITSLAFALAPKNYAAALTWYMARSDGKSTPGLSESAATMLGIARHWVQMEQTDLVKVERATKKVNCRRKRIVTATRRRRRTEMQRPTSRGERRRLPLALRLRSEDPQRRPANEVALNIERVVDGGMKADEPLRGSCGLEPLHLPLPSSRRLVRILRPIVRLQPLFMARRKAELTEG